MKLQVINKDIFRVDIPHSPSELVSDNAYEVEFEFDDEWQGKTITARASKGYDEDYVDVIVGMDGKAVFNLTTGVWYISAWASGLTSRPYKQYFEVSGKSFNGNPAEPESPYYQQILDRMDELEQGAVSPEAIVEAVNNYLDEHPVEGADEDTVNALIAQYLVDNPIDTLDADDVNALITQYLVDNPVDAYTKAQTDSLLEGKANANNVYTKDETNALIPNVPVKSISLNGATVSPDSDGNVALSVSTSGGATIDDSSASASKVYSSQKTEQLVSGCEKTANRLGTVNPSADTNKTDKYYSAAGIVGYLDKFVPHYISARSWAVGDYCSFNGTIYRCTTAHSNVQWTAGYWTAVASLAEDISERIRALTPLPTKTLSSISATKTKTSYDVDEQFSTADVTVTASYSDSTSADVTSSATIGTVDTSTSGNKTLNISYTEDGVTKTTTISITVVASIISDPVVPQTGTWQYKSTPTKGYIIIGKDDDTSDQAQFVRMVSGYGYPVTINTTYASKDNTLASDADTANSTYPTGSESTYPNGTTVETLNKHIINDELGEVAQHDLSAKSIWDSTNIDDYMDGMYATYTAGGGTKTKAELKTAILEKYADTDVAQGADRIDEQRALLKASLEYPIYTLGEWGASGDTIVIDDINLGNLHDNMRSSTTLVAREKNYMADGILSHSNNSMPFKIFRNSEGLSNAANAASMCEMAQSELSAIEVFCHLYIHNDSATDWDNLKSALDAIKSAVDAGKVEVVTRKQFSELGEYVEHPITALSFSPKELSYDVGATLSAADFNCNAVLDDLSTVACASDKVVDLSQVNVTTAGTYTATLYYRGKKQTCSVTISSEPTPEYILANKSYSGSDASEGFNLASETFSVEAGKTYRFDFDFTAETSVRYSTHYIALGASKQNGIEPRHWSANTTTITTTEGTTTAHVVVDMVADVTRTVAELFKWSAILNTTVGAWSITNLYCWEIVN